MRSPHMETLLFVPDRINSVGDYNSRWVGVAQHNQINICFQSIWKRFHLNWKRFYLNWKRFHLSWKHF